MTRIEDIDELIVESVVDKSSGNTSDPDSMGALSDTGEDNPDGGDIYTLPQDTDSFEVKRATAATGNLILGTQNRTNALEIDNTSNELIFDGVVLRGVSEVSGSIASRPIVSLEGAGLEVDLDGNLHIPQGDGSLLDADTVDGKDADELGSGSGSGSLDPSADETITGSWKFDAPTGLSTISGSIVGDNNPIEYLSGLNLDVDSNGYFHVEQGAGSGLDADMLDGREIYVQDTEPSNWSNGDLWFKPQ